MSDRDQTLSDTDPPPRPPMKERVPADPVSAVAGLVFITVALLALADGFWIDVDGVVVTGAAIAAVGVAMILSVVVRAVSRRRSRGGIFVEQS